MMTCGNGGYVIKRHNVLRNLEAKLLENVCKDVKIEPALLPTSNVIKGNKSEGARLDISAVGFWSECERTFFDVRITHPTADSYMKKSMDVVYKQHEKEKKDVYNDRVMNVEKGSLTPLVFSTTGGMGPECSKMNKRLALLISNKNGEKYAHVLNHIRTRLRFALLKSILVAIRGVRGQKKYQEKHINDISFNLIPNIDTEI